MEKENPIFWSGYVDDLIVAGFGKEKVKEAYQDSAKHLVEAGLKLHKEEEGERLPALGHVLGPRAKLRPKPETIVNLIVVIRHLVGLEEVRWQMIHSLLGILQMDLSDLQIAYRSSTRSMAG